MAIEVYHLTIKPQRDIKLPRYHGSMLHGALYSALDRLDSSLASALHADGPKPFTISLLSGQTKSGAMFFSSDTKYNWRLVALEEKAVCAFRMLAFDGEYITVGREIFKICREQGDGPTLEKREYSALLQSAGIRKDTSLTMYFQTPVTFRQGKKEIPLPLPDLVWKSLLNKWLYWSADINDAPSSEMLYENIWINRMEGKTVRVSSGTRATTGFIGKFSYEFKTAEDSLRRWILALALFAEYTGVGWQTAQGMGQIRLKIGR